MKIVIFIILLFCVSPLSAQESNIFTFLDSIEHVLETENLPKARKDSLEKIISLESMNIIRDTTRTKQEHQFAGKKKLAQIQRRLAEIDKKRAPKPISEKVLNLENRLASMQDSITKIQKKLVEIIETDSIGRKSKERATQTLLKIRKPEIIEYAFINKDKFSFGEMDWDEETDESYRTAIDGLYQNYPLHTAQKWTLLPYALKYLKDNNGYEHFSEFYYLYSFFEKGDLKSPELLFEFMIQNADEEVSKYMYEIRTEYYSELIFEYKE